MVIFHLSFHKPYNMYTSYKSPTIALGLTIWKGPKTNHPNVQSSEDENKGTLPQDFITCTPCYKCYISV